MKTLTKAEEQVMQILWQLERAFTKEIVAEFDTSKKPSYTTVATVLTVLEKKGFVQQEMIGNAKRYSPLVAKNEYAKEAAQGLISKYFDGSLSTLVSFFSEKDEVDIKEIDQIIQTLNKHKKRP